MAQIQWNGHPHSFDHPRELRYLGHPVPPRQPVVNWAASLAHFQVLCDGDQFEEAIKWLLAEHCFAVMTDVPEGKRDAFKSFVARHFKPQDHPITDSSVV